MSPFVWFTIHVYEKLKEELPPQILEMMSEETLCYISWLAVQDFPKGEIQKRAYSAPLSAITKAKEFAEEKWVERQMTLQKVEQINLSDHRYMVE